MRKHFFVVTISVSLLILAVGIFAQGDQRPAAPIESSFEITLSVVAGSNDTAQRGELPQALAPVARQLRAAYGLSNLRLVDSYIGRIGNNGAMSYKSLTNIDGNAQSNTPSFLDWQIAGLRNAANGAPNSIFILSFRFGARVPVVIGQSANSSPVQYENIGLTIDRMTASLNSPVLLGTVALPKADGGRVFLVLNVSPVTN
jgi:hypothetical protein